MNTTKILVLVLLLTGCGSSMMQVSPPPPQDGGSPDIIVTAADLSGTWSISMTPFDRVQTMVPAPCSGMMLLASSEVGYSGTFACDDGRTGNIDATPSGTQYIIGAWTPGLTGAQDRWLYSFVDVTAHSLSGQDFSATR